MSRRKILLAAVAVLGTAAVGAVLFYKKRKSNVKIVNEATAVLVDIEPKETCRCTSIEKEEKCLGCGRGELVIEQGECKLHPVEKKKYFCFECAEKIKKLRERLSSSMEKIIQLKSFVSFARRRSLLHDYALIRGFFETPNQLLLDMKEHTKLRQECEEFIKQIQLIDNSTTETLPTYTIAF